MRYFVELSDYVLASGDARRVNPANGQTDAKGSLNTRGSGDTA